MAIDRQVVLRGDGVVPVGRRDRDDAHGRRHAARAHDDRGVQRLGRPADDPRLRRPRLAHARRACGRSRRFVVNFVGGGRSELCLLFASKEEDKFARVAWRPTAAGHAPAPRGRARVGGVLDRPRARDRRPRLLVAAGRGRRRAAGARAAAHVLPPLVGRVVADAGAGRPGPVAIPAIEVSGRDLRWQGASLVAERFLAASPGRSSVGRLTVMSARWRYSSRLLTCHDAGGRSMRFSLYTEMQLHEGKTPAAAVRARCSSRSRTPTGSATTATPRSSTSSSRSSRSRRTRRRSSRPPRSGRRTSASARCSTSCRTTTRWCWRRVIAVTDILTGGRYEWGVGRGHGWIPEKAGVPLDEHARPRYEEAVDLLFTALGNERFSHKGEYFEVGDSHVVPFPTRNFRVFVGGTSDRTYELAAEHGWGVAVPPLCRTRRSRSSSTSTARSAPSTARRRTSSGSTRATSTRTATRRCARRATG